MFYSIEIPGIVHRDIVSLTDYLFRVSFSHQVAKKVYDDLYATIFSLEFLPNRYEKYFGDYRRVIINGSYKMIYRVVEEEKKVIIIRIFRVESNNYGNQ